MTNTTQGCGDGAHGRDRSHLQVGRYLRTKRCSSREEEEEEQRIKEPKTWSSPCEFVVGIRRAGAPESTPEFTSLPKSVPFRVKAQRGQTTRDIAKLSPAPPAEVARLPCRADWDARQG